jgi:hypothetical protein
MGFFSGKHGRSCDDYLQVTFTNTFLNPPSKILVFKLTSDECGNLNYVEPHDSSKHEKARFKNTTYFLYDSCVSFYKHVNRHKRCCEGTNSNYCGCDCTNEAGKFLAKEIEKERERREDEDECKKKHHRIAPAYLRYINCVDGCGFRLNFSPQNHSKKCHNYSDYRDNKRHHVYVYFAYE